RIEPHALARGDEQRAVAVEDEAMAEMTAADGLRRLTPDHLYVGQAIAIEPRARNGAAALNVVSGVEEPAKPRVALIACVGGLLRRSLGVRQVDELVLCEVGIDGHVEQAALFALAIVVAKD